MSALTVADQKALAFAWHDTTCPEGGECRSRDLHADATGLRGHVLRAVVASGLLTKAKAAGLREAADDIETDWAPTWGGDGMWMTTGTKVAELVAGTLRSMAQEIES